MTIGDGSDPRRVLDLSPSDPSLQARRMPIPRQMRRTTLPLESPGRLVLPSQLSLFVTLRDISRSGCCAVRKGPLALRVDEQVIIDFWREDISTKASLQASVRWLSSHQGTTLAGLCFIDTSVKTDRAIDRYLQRSALLNS